MFLGHSLTYPIENIYIYIYIYKRNLLYHLFIIIEWHIISWLESLDHSFFCLNFGRPPKTKEFCPTSFTTKKHS